MVRRCLTLGVIIGILFLASCQQRAQRYKAIIAPKPDAKDEPKKDDYRLTWMEPRETNDIPIVFVSSANKPEWDKLDKFWTPFPPYPECLPTATFALPPLQALATLVLIDHHQAIKIKVPRGLPDLPKLPANRLPTYGRWRIGQELFFDRSIPVGKEYYACATCHDPKKGFSDGRRQLAPGMFNTLSLVNVAYNQRQFWDGRVRTLEETLVRSVADERIVGEDESRKRALEQHIFGGFVRELIESKKYDKKFDLVFGIERPTQDAVARALATYLRTILSGASVYDQADMLRGADKAKPMTAEHFKGAPKDDYLAARLKDLEKKGRPSDEMPALLAKGYELFHGKGRCAQCHKGPLFTDHDYHNNSIEAPPFGTLTGRALHVPIGQVELRLIAAYRTPSLRNLAKTGPYFHDGSQLFLREVVEFYDEGVRDSRSLAKVLMKDARPQRLQLKEDEKDALVMFLHALEGRPVDPIVMGQGK